MAIWPLSGFLLLQLLMIILSLAFSLEAQSNRDNDTAQVPTSWTNNISAPVGSPQRILTSANFFCGFQSYWGESDSFYFGVLFEEDGYGYNEIWLANEKRPVGKNATLKLLPDGNLVLRDADESLVWSTGTSNMSVAGMKIKESGNLILYDGNNKTVWQSFNSTANVSSSWMNDDASARSVSRYKPRILANEAGFSCGFYSTYERNHSFYFAIWKGPKIVGGENRNVIWLANRNRPVRENATLQFLQGGNLVLRDADGTLVWSTNTSNMSVAGMQMKETGNLVLYDVNNKTVWQSFDYATDTLFPGQKLMAGQKLVASVSDADISEGSFTLSVMPQGVFAFYQADVPQMYFKFSVYGTVESIQLNYDKSVNGPLALFVMSALLDDLDATVFTSPVHYSASARMKFDSDGHLRLYDDHMVEGVDLLADILNKCDYPTTCGNYGLCSMGQCSCPAGFTQDDTSNDRTKYNCSQINPTTCENHQSQYLVLLEDVYYFNYVDHEAAVLKGTDMKSCKDECLKNCSCKAALFQYFDHNVSYGNCFLPSPVLSLTSDGKGRKIYQSYAFIKMSNDGENGAGSPNGESGGDSPPSAIHPKIIAGSISGGFLLLGLIAGLWIALSRKKRDGEEGMEDYLDQLPGMPMRFTCQELKVATKDFNKKLGEGGFGSVFEGNLENGEQIAVKRLDGVGQGMKEFLAEVKTIGSIHHVNLVRLMGFCAEKLDRLLVYEFMCNGSLDKWIFYKEPLLHPLEWQTRRNIILDIAKGLAYLHEGCRKRIAHLDIKPQNILLDANLQAKISDFGLSKLIDRDQSQVVTTMRGTPGYLAPELFSSVVTEKADVYSFGIVVMEIACGRKNLDRSQPECMHLLPVFMEKAQEDQLIDMVDKYSEDMQLHRSEAVEMLRIAVWCLQSDFTRRPSMPTVVKVIEGAMGIEAELDYNIQNPTTSAGIIRYQEELGITSSLLPSVLSGPR